MLVNESLLNRMNDPDDDFAALVCAHEVAHLWFGCYVGLHWWDDVWLDEAMATYLCYSAEVDVLAAAQPWTAFCYWAKQSAYQADELPSRLPVSSPVDSAADALAKPGALVYSKGASVVRQFGALIGPDALHAGLHDYMTRYGPGTAAMDDIVACWSRAAGRDLAGWADQWLRTDGASTLRPELVVAPDGTIISAAVLQDDPRTHRIRVGLYDLDGDVLSRRAMLDAEVSGTRTPLPALAGTRAPDALVLNDGDLTYARIGLDERTRATLAQVAMDVGDPLTEAECWNAAWRLVTGGELAAAEFVALVTRRLDRPRPLLRAGVEELLERAVSAADTWAPAPLRAGLRGEVADAALRADARAQPGSPVQRALAAGFAASAHRDDQLGRLRSWLAGASLPDGVTLTTNLRGRILFTLSARGLASDDDLDAMVSRDPVRGTQNRATGRALRPNPAAKQAAWTEALDPAQDWQLAVASARGIWVPGQDDALAGLRDRYFTEALPALAGRDPERAADLAQLLYPATLMSADTLAATDAALLTCPLGHRLRMTVLDQQAILRAVLTARGVPTG